MIKTADTKKIPTIGIPKKKTILVLSAHTIARVFKIDKDDIEELSPIHTDETEFKYSDKEGFSYAHTAFNTGIWTTTGYKEKNKTHYNNVFTSFLAKEIVNIDKWYTAEQIMIYAPKDMKEIIKKHFPQTYEKKLKIMIGDHIKISYPKLFDLLK